MSEQFELVFYGELVPGVQVTQAKQNVAELFKASIEQVERMFSGQRVVIRNKLDAETAQKYLLAMQKRGAVCKLETMGGAAPMPAAEKAPAPDSAPAQSGPAAPKPAVVAPAASITTVNRREYLAKVGRLPIAGEKVEAILAEFDATVAPAGQRLSDERHVEAPVFAHLDELKLTPTGTNLQDQKDDLPVSIPDVSHLRLE